MSDQAGDRLRVLLLNYEYPPLGGGAANATAHLVREFTRYPALSMDIVTSSTGPGRVEKAGGVAIHFLDIGKRGGLHHQSMRDLIAYSWRAYRYAARLLGRERYDLCHAFFGIPCGWIARRLGLPYIVSLRGSDVPFFNERFRHLDRLVFRRVSKGVWRDAASVVANSEGLRELAWKTAPSQSIDVIGNGIDTQTFRPAGTIEGGGLRILCVSRLTTRKRIDLLIRAVAALPDKDATLTLAGTGKEEDALRALARREGLEGRVRFLGFVERDRLPALYGEHNLFVLPSVNEGMSSALLEAMASGLAAIVTDTGGCRELLRHGENGFVVAKDSMEDLAARLEYYAGHPEAVRVHGARSREIAEPLGWEHVAAAYWDQYRRIAERPAR